MAKKTKSAKKAAKKAKKSKTQVDRRSQPDRAQDLHGQAVDSALPDRRFL